jgi:hypothetical protein
LCNRYDCHILRAAMAVEQHPVARDRAWNSGLLLHLREPTKLNRRLALPPRHAATRNSTSIYNERRPTAAPFAC